MYFKINLLFIKLHRNCLKILAQKRLNDIKFIWLKGIILRQSFCFKINETEKKISKLLTGRKYFLKNI